MRAQTTSRREAMDRLRRDLILQAAERVFARRPFEEASMQEIAAEAEIGMHGLYRHFASKDVLYEEIVLGRLDEIRARLSALPAVKDPRERLKRLAAAYAGYFLERPQFYPLWASRKLSRDWDLKTRHAKALERRMAEIDREILDTIGAGVQRGLFRAMDTKLLVTLAVGVFGAVLEHHLLEAKPADAERCAAEMVDLFLRGAAK